MFDPTPTQLRGLIEAAIRAPSADNQHHVSFAVDDAGMTLQADQAFVRCEENHRRLLMLLSFGAVVENLRLALSEHGWTFTPSWFPRAGDGGCLLRIEWALLDPVAAADPLGASIASRHTNRGLLRGPPLTEAESRALRESIDGYRDVRLQWCDASGPRRSLLRLIRIAETARFESRALHEELFGSIAFDAGWKRATAERLAPATLGVEPFLRAPFAALRHWRVMRWAAALGMHRLLGLRAGDLPPPTAPHLGVLLSTKTPDAAALAIGAAFQRLWLTADRLGLALQPMVASAILAVQSDNDDPVRRNLRDVLKDRWRELVGDDLPLIVFRLGRARSPAVRSGRRPVDEYIADPLPVRTTFSETRPPASRSA